jgi:hypothetical protein
MAAIDDVQKFLWEIIGRPEDDPRVTMNHKLKAAKIIADVIMKKAYIYANSVTMIELHRIQEEVRGMTRELKEDMNPGMFKQLEYVDR